MTTMKIILKILPNFLGSNIRNHLMFETEYKVENRCDDILGCIIVVYSFTNFSQGKILYGSGKTAFEVEFQSIVFRPQVGGVLDSICNEVLQTVIIATAGPIKIVIDQKCDGYTIKYRKDYVRIVVSENRKILIKPGTELRTKILSYRKSLIDYKE